MSSESVPVELVKMMLPVATAASIILENAIPLGVEWVDLSAASDRVLAEDIASPADFPAAPTSSMDGYAVRHQDLETLPRELEAIETVPAGSVPSLALQSGQTTRLFTGSLLPAGADTVVMQEVVTRIDERTVRIEAGGDRGQFVRPQGHFGRQGDRVLRVGQHLSGPEIAVLAAVQRSRVSVYQRPRVAILSTGNELVRIDQPLAPGQIVDSNQHGLAALVVEAGGIPECLGIIADTEADSVAAGEARLKAAIARAVSRTDIVLSTGGVSVGDYDRVDAVLADLNAQIHFQKVAIKPGKPLTCATFARSISPVLYFGLPGNPVSAMACFWRFVRPALRKLQGRTAPWDPAFFTAIAQANLKAGGKRETYLWGTAIATATGLEFVPANEHGSGNLINLAGTNALAVVPIGQTRISAGAPVQVMLTRSLR